MTPTASELVPWVVWASVLVLCALVDALFSGLETGIYVMNKHRLDLHAEAGVSGARFLQRALQKPANLLGVLLIGTNLARYLATFSISAMFVLAGHEARAEWYTLLLATPLLFIVGDSVPKAAFQRLEAAAVYRLVWFLRASGVLFRVTGIFPLVITISSLLMKLTGARGGSGGLGHEGAAAVLAEGRASGTITAFQSAMADRVMRIGDLRTADAMIPMDRVVWVREGAGREELIEIIRKHNYSRIPIRNEGGAVVTVLHVYDILATEGPADPIEKMDPPLRLSAELTVTDALYRMRGATRAMAIIERDGEDVGIVTIKDLVEEIVGELEDW